MGKILKMNNNENFIVTGIVEKPPSNSHISFDMMASFETLYKRRPEDLAWYNWNYQTYIELEDGADWKEFEKKFISFNEKYIGGFVRSIGGEISNFLQPLTSIHLHSNMENELSANSDIRYVYAFMAIAVFILLIACINFMNLSTARSANRAKEVGLRKVVGAERSMLIKQFLGESFLMALISVLFAILIVRLVSPHFNTLAGREISVKIIRSPWVGMGFLGIVLFVGFIAGSYPAFFLSGFRPVHVLKGQIKRGVRSSRLRSILVIFQFAISITLIIPLRDEETILKVELIKTELSGIEGVQRVCGSMKVPGEEFFNTSIYFPEGFASDQSVLFQNFYVDDDFLQTYDIELMEGRNFSEDMSTDRDNAILINETAVKQLGWENGVGKKIYQSDDVEDPSARRALTVVGVIQDIHHRSVHHVVEANLIQFRTGLAERVTVKLNTNSVAQTMKRIEAKWNTIAPSHPFDYFFLDDYYDGLYRSEVRLGSIFQTFTLFAIIIGCLGLFGLASFAAEQRTKEIGIRKVLGSTAGSIVLILCKEFVLLVGIANLFAWPIAHLTMKKWLQSFPYRADIHVMTFIMAGVVAMLIALLTVSYRALKAAGTNTVEALKYE